MTIVVVSGNPRPQSRTLHLATEVGAALATRLDRPAPQTIDVSDLGVRLLQPADPTVTAAIATLRGAGILVVATPTYKGSYTGVLKVLLDQLPTDSLKNIPAVTVVTAGIQPQADAAQRNLRELLGELGAIPVNPALSVTEGALADAETAAAEYADSIASQLAPA